MSNCKEIAAENKKGGKGKSTTFNLGVGLVRERERVILVDYDSQGDLAICCGYQDNDEIETTVSTIMRKEISDELLKVDEVIIH